MIDRFMKFVGEPDENGCRNWLGSHYRRGYGQFKVGNTGVRAHRFAYQIKYGAIPTGMLVRHRCDNPSCVEISHLELGSHTDNMNDRMDRGRTLTGTRNHKAKLTEPQVVAIRADKRTTVEIAATYGVSNVLISYIKHRKIWRHVA